MVVMFRSCVENELSLPEVARVPEALVMSLKGPSRTCIVCRASMVADGGVFSPRMALGCCLVDGLRLGVSFSPSRGRGVGVVDRSGDLSGELAR